MGIETTEGVRLVCGDRSVGGTVHEGVGCYTGMGFDSWERERVAVDRGWIGWEWGCVAVGWAFGRCEVC